MGIDSLFQTSLMMTPRCFLKCDFCTLWQTSEPSEDKAINLTHFLHKNRSKKIVNILGGDPFFSAQLPHVLTTLKKNHKKIHIWVTGQATLDAYAFLTSYVSRVFLHLPSFDPDTYRQISGLDGHAAMLEAVAFFGQHRVPVSFFHRVTSATLDLLPDFHAFAFDHGCELVLFCDPQTLESPSQGDYVKRYYAVPGVSVYYGRADLNACAALYPSLLTSFFQNLKNEYYHRLP